jgi:hypothetical protein
VSKFIRHVLVILAALPIFLGLATASLSVPIFAAPCPHSHGGSTDALICPCCEKVILAASVACLTCQLAIATGSGELRARAEAHSISFRPFEQRARGLEIKPPLPPPRLMVVS